MMLYEKLNEEMQRTVDEFAGVCRNLPWIECSGLLVETALPFAEEFAGTAASLAARGFLTAVLERLEIGAVEDPYLAHLLRLSLNPRHHSLAEAYLANNPEAWSLLELERAPKRKELVN